MNCILHCLSCLMLREGGEREREREREKEDNPAVSIFLCRIMSFAGHSVIFVSAEKATDLTFLPSFVSTSTISRYTVTLSLSPSPALPPPATPTTPRGDWLGWARDIFRAACSEARASGTWPRALWTHPLISWKMGCVFTSKL